MNWRRHRTCSWNSSVGQVHLVAFLAQTVVHGRATAPECHKARVWYCVPRPTSTEVAMVPGDAAACTFSSVDGHANVQLCTSRRSNHARLPWREAFCEKGSVLTRARLCFATETKKKDAPSESEEHRHGRRGVRSNEHGGGVRTAPQPPARWRATGGGRPRPTALGQKRAAPRAGRATPARRQRPPPTARSARGVTRRRPNGQKSAVFLTFDGNGARIRKSSGPKERPLGALDGAPTRRP